MLPHILHSTTRSAAAVVHNQTQALRNVLQLQTSNPSSGSNSNRGNGPSSGGAKFNPGSRFHTNYNDAGRAVTQANIVTSHDVLVSQSDEPDDFPPRRAIRPTPRKRQRIRSSSVSLTLADPSDRGESLGVLKTVQIHARECHAFAPAETLALAKQRLLADRPENGQTHQLLLVRRNSTSSRPPRPLSPGTEADSAPLPSGQPVKAVKEDGPVTGTDEPVVSVDPAAPQTVAVAPPPSPKDTRDYFLRRLDEIAESRDSKAATDFVRYMLNNKMDPTLEHFNAAFHALFYSREPGEPLNAIIRLYNSMLDKSIVPNVRTYELLIGALTTRDFEVHKAILSLDQRVKHVPFMSRDEVAALDADKARIEKLKTEENFASAMSLFESILGTNGKERLGLGIFIRLLRSCAYHADVKAAIRVFGQLEQLKHLKLKPVVYQNMMLTFMNADRLDGTEEIFHAYIAACKNGSLGQHKGAAAETGRHQQIQVWNTMIEAYFRSDAEKAITLVEQMMNSKSTNSFAIDEVPVPTSSMFATVIAGFIQNQDIATALSWFDKLLLQETAPINPFQGLDGKAMKPNTLAWQMMFDALANADMVDQLNRLYKIARATYAENHIFIRGVDHLIVYRANLDNLENLTQEQALEVLTWLGDALNSDPVPGMKERWTLMMDLCLEYITRGEYVTPFNLMSEFIVGKLSYITERAESPSSYQRLELQHVFLTVCEALHRNLQDTTNELPWVVGLTLSRLSTILELKPQARFAPYLIPAYSKARYVGGITYDDFHVADWNVLLRFSTYIELNAMRANPDALIQIVDEFGLGRVSAILQDMASHGVTFDEFSNDLQLEVLQVLESQYDGEQGRREFLKKLGPTYAEAAEKMEQIRFGALESELSRGAEPLLQAETTSLASSPSYSSSFSQGSESSSQTSTLSIHALLTRSIEEMLDSGPHHKPKFLQAYKIFEKNLCNNMVPEPSAIARLIQAFGRAGDLEKVRQLYTVAQDVLPLLKSTLQLAAWGQIENSMVIALAHGGYPDAAHVHRIRILDQGMAPTADAYGVLIQHVKDTTDDTSGAMALFQEALERGVGVNLYLYNNIISKLSKARKVDYALELFQQMKSANIVPSSITYGAVIGACARVGDVKSAELLFQEMVHSRNFKPRVPPYNTMMQLYTTTKPSRGSALHYYKEMRDAGVKPSSHTYKLLLDTYGAIEPVDLRAMESVFYELQDDTSVELTGAHFASLINAYGCVAKQFDKAISIFETMHTVPRAPAPEAVVFEAVINVIVAHKRTELFPIYIEKMNKAGVHMTAYIANFLIKGYANIGDLQQSREIFESLVDPPVGVAAPNNHTPHNVVGGGAKVHIMEPVYREPSTWEAMVRAELGAGNRDVAMALLERLKTRGYPEAVYNRISGVMTDHSAIVA